MVVRRAAVFVLLIISFVPIVLAQSQAPPPTPLSPSPQMDEQTAKDRRYALDLYREGKLLDALPWLEKVVAAAPNDAIAREALGMSLEAQAFSLADPAQRKAIRIRARQQLLRAKELGDTTDFLVFALGALPEDGSEPTYSQSRETDRLIKQGEAAFAAGNWDDAKKAYLQALLLDPNSYEILLFMGDVYYRKGDPVAAGEWFSRAIQVDPNRETAYRYWADALLKRGKFAAAREKFIEAVICDPYNQRTWSGLNNYLRIINQKATWYKFQSPNSFSANDKGGTINLDPASLNRKDGSSAWVGYPMERLLWKNEKFAKAYPNEKQYRHSLKEESSALSLVAATAQELAAGKKPEKLGPDLQALVNLNNAGLLDPYILINVPDQGIAQDYLPYRQAHRDLLIRYLGGVVMPSAPPDRD